MPYEQPGTGGSTLEQMQERVRAVMARPRIRPPEQKVIAWPVSDMNNNPMSPHRISKSKIFYKDAADAINTRSYFAYYPVSAGPIDAYYRDNGFPPPFQIDPDRESDWDRGAITIAGMIDLMESRLPFSLAHPKDVIEIQQLVELYLSEISPYVSEYPRLNAEIRRCRKFLDYIEGWVQKVSRTAPKKGSLASLLSKISRVGK